MTAITYELDGQQLTIKQICAKITAVSECTIRRRLKEGARTTQEVIDETKARQGHLNGVRRGGDHWRTFGA